jgi:tetratricopeptide (TPR) repeat protein
MSGHELSRIRPIWIGLSCCMAACPLVGCTVGSKVQNAEGVRMYQQAHFPGAQEKFQQAIQNDPNNADAYYNLAATYHQLGKASQQQADLQQAETLYNQCLDHDPNHRDCHRALAVLLMDEQRHEEAFRLVEGWAARNPLDPEPKIELARLFDEAGDREQAKQYLVEALGRQPNNARALAALGKIREDLGEHGQALADYQRSLALDRFQPQVASRVSALQSAMGVSAPLTPMTASGRPISQGPILR